MPVQKGPSKVKNAVFTALGGFFLFLGILGIPLPILPSTPFFLLAAFFFATSSPRLSRWMRSKPFISRRLDKLERGEGLSARDRVGLWCFAAVILAPLIVFSPSWHLSLFLVLLLVAKGVFFVVWKPPKRPDATE